MILNCIRKSKSNNTKTWKKEEKKREISGKTHVYVIITIPVVIPMLPAISLSDSSSFLSPPLPFFYFFSFFLCFGWTIIYSSFVLCGSWFMSHLDLSCEFNVLFWNLKQLLDFFFVYFLLELLEITILHKKPFIW